MEATGHSCLPPLTQNSKLEGAKHSASEMEGHFDFNRIMRKDHYKCALRQKGKQFPRGPGACSPRENEKLDANVLNFTD